MNIRKSKIWNQDANPTDNYGVYHRATFPVQNKDITKDIRKWCFETFDASGYSWLTKQIRWIDRLELGQIDFANENDLALFMLRWL